MMDGLPKFKSLAKPHPKEDSPYPSKIDHIRKTLGRGRRSKSYDVTRLRDEKL